MSELTLEHVSYRYKNGERLALNDVSCTFEGGKLYAVVGPSGSGKTTLLSIMAGLDQPSDGKISVDGEDLKNLDQDRYRRERASMIFQAFQLFPLLTVLENVCYPMEMNNVPVAQAKKRAKELLTSVEIADEKQKRFPSNLSGGEQQRVAIARALASDAQIILADEPTGNLDVENGKRVMAILRRLAHENGYCVIVVTHDLSIAETSDQVWRMSDGMFQEKTV
jgi:putative ABC transport system ATP-binding protein